MKPSTVCTNGSKVTNKPLPRQKKDHMTHQPGNLDRQRAPPNIPDMNMLFNQRKIFKGRGNMTPNFGKK